jgi:citrate lyase subunit beta/citryl-CoA lyase
MRSLFFVPGSRPDMIAKVPRFQPDVAVVDLEDAVVPADKESARAATVEALSSLDLPSAVIRVNAVDTPWFADDMAAVVSLGRAGKVVGLVLPKLQRLSDLETLRTALGDWSPEVVVGGLETALGVADARQLIVPPVTAVFFGAEDYTVDMGGRRTAGGLEVLYARSQVVQAARLAGVPAIDQIVAAIRDPDAFRADASVGRDLGYAGKLCIHPSQVALAHEVFTPSEGEIAHARAVIAASREAALGGSGAGVLDGEMIDEVHVRLAMGVLRAAGLEV